MRPFAALSLCSVVISLHAFGQCPPEFIAGPFRGVPGTDDQTNAMVTWDPDGGGPAPSVLVAGGYFAIAGEAIANHIAYWDGTAWHALGAGFDGDVFALTVFQGTLVAGGSFTHSGSRAMNHVAYWDGANWQQMGAGANDTVMALTTYNTVLVAGGAFSQMDNVAVGRIAQWNGSSWQALGGTGLTGNGGLPFVASLCIFQSKLYVGGAFDFAGGNSANHIAYWTGSSWNQPLSGVAGGSSPEVAAMCVYNGNLIVGGSFTTASGTTVNNIAKWTGGAWAQLTSGILPSQSFAPPPVQYLVQSGTALLCGGHFMTAGGATALNIAMWSDATASWTGFGGGADGSVAAIAFFNGDTVIGGAMHHAGGTLVQDIARYNGSAWFPMGTGFNNSVYALGLYQGELVAGGQFGHAGDIDANAIAHWNGSSWRRFGTGMTAGTTSSYVNAVAVFPTSTNLVAGGYFTNAGGATVKNIAQWNGSIWQPVGTGTSNEVKALAIYGGNLAIGGDFQSANGQTFSNIVFWDGQNWTGAGSGTNGPVFGLAVQGSDLFAGGSFGLVYNVSDTAHIARWDGSWHSLETGMDGLVICLATYRNELVAGGSFTTAGGKPIPNIASWNGSTWHALGSGLTGGEVAGLVVYNGELICSGNFTTAGSAPANGLARWNGTDWKTIGGGLNGAGKQCVVFGSELVTCGIFEVADGQVSKSWARWIPTETALTVTDQPAAYIACLGQSAIFQATCGGSTPIAFTWQKDSVPVNTSDPRIDVSSINGGLSSQLTILNVQASDFGDYSCVASNDCGSIQTISVALTQKLVTGDVNGNGIVDLSDLSTLLSNYGRTDNPPLSVGNLNGDSSIDLSDLALLLANYGSQCN